MTTSRTITALVAVAGLAAAATAQDSVSNAGTGLPGDALSPYSPSTQRANYVVDLAPLTTSWGNEFGIAPLLKTSKAQPTFFNNLASANGLSQDLLTGVEFPADQYALWEGAPGFGVNPDQNDAPNTIAPPSSGTLFGAVQAGFGGNTNSVIGAVAGFDPANPSRIYVSRVVAAINGNDASEDSASFGVGAIDASGNTYFRADDFGTSGPNPVSGNNVFRVNILNRDVSAANVISGLGAADAAATDGIIVSSGTTHTVPAAIPASIAGRPVYSGPNFDSQWVFESAPGSTSTTTSHIFGSGGTSTDHRGAASFSPATFPAYPDSVGTFSLLGRPDDTREILVFGIDADGNVIGSDELALPQIEDVSTIVDPVDTFTLDFDFSNAVQNIGQFDGYHSQSAFNGGNGLTHVGVLPSGQGIAVGQVYNSVSSATNSPPINDPFNSVVAGIFDPDNPSDVDWTLVSWVDLPTRLGKPIKDGPGGNEIGNLTILSNVTGGNPAGPSVSHSFIDAAGNIWFIHAIVQEKVDPDTGDVFTDFDSGLIRAVYDPAAGGWELELVLELGDVFTGLNSGLPYQVTFLGIADSDSVSSGTLASNSGIQQAFNGLDPADLDQDDPRTLGGLVVSAEITYDVDGDGDFEDPTGGGADPTSTDESYDVALLIANTIPADDLPCPADLTGPDGAGNPDGVLDANDFFFYLGLFASGDSRADLTGAPDGGPDDIIDANDFFEYLSLFAAGCP